MNRTILGALIALAAACSNDLFITTRGDVDEANAMLTQGQFQAALDAYDALGLTNPRIAFNRGLALFHLKQWEDAIGAFDELRDSQDKGMKATSYFHIGNTYAAKAREAEEAGNSEGALEDWKEAVVAYENVLAVDPENLQAKEQLELALFKVDPPCLLRNDELEPNQDFGQAQTLTLREATGENAAPGERSVELPLWLCPDDEDWFEVEVSPGDRLFAEVEHREGPDHAKAAVEIWAPDGTQKLRPATEEALQKVQLMEIAVPGNYRIRVHDPRGDDFGYTAKIALRPACSRTEDKYEPNNLQGSAKSVEAGDLQPLRLCPTNDDWYQVELSQGQSLRATATVKAQKGTLELRLVDASGAELAKAKKGEQKDTLSALAYAQPGGPVFVHVSGTLDVEAVYSLKLEVIPICAEREDKNEEDDTLTLASESRLGDQNGLQMCPGDPDLFRIKVKAGESVVAHVRPETLAGTPAVQVLDVGGRALAQGFKLKDGLLALALDPGEGTYYVSVGSLDADAKYDLKLQVLPACPEGNDTEESNNSAADAKVLELPQKEAPGEPASPNPQDNPEFMECAQEIGGTMAQQMGLSPNQKPTEEQLEQLQQAVIQSCGKHLQAGAATGGQPPKSKQKLLRICPGDQDWFKINVGPETPLHSAGIQFVHTKGDLDLVLYEADGETRAGESAKSTEAQNGEAVVVPPPTAQDPRSG
jgi:tetratricopeptide (TPR) repeat protein